MDATPDAKWIKGINSLIDPSLLMPGEYPWSVNTDNTGGIIQTRQGFNAVGVKDAPLPSLEPKGCEIFKGKDGSTKFILALGGELWAMSFPIVGDFKKIGQGFAANLPVFFTKTLQSVQLQADGTLKVIDEPIPYLIMTNGVERARYWDGFNLKVASPEGDHGHPGIPVGKITAWSGNRLWISNGKKLMSSDLGNPLAFFEATYVAGGGALFFDDEITGMTQTTDFQNLIVCSDFDTSAVQTNIYDRTIWGSTPGFQRIIFPGVGCAAPKSFVRQWGITWWMSHGGWVGMDQALMTYQRSRIQYRDQQMMRAKERLNGDKSGICSSKFGNYLTVSVPYGSRFNAGTWVLNQRVLDISAPSPVQDFADPAGWASQWTGIQPVDYALAVIDGQERLFCLSRHDNLDGNAQPVVWEMFTGERQDRYNDTTYRIPCMFETRLLAFSDDLKRFHYGEIDVSELLGLIDCEAFVAGRNGNYHSIMTKKIVASPGSINSAITANYVGTVTEDTPGDALFIPVDSVEGALDAPSLIFINGLAYPYIDVQVGGGEIGGGNPPQTIETGAEPSGFILSAPGGINPPPLPPPPGTPPPDPIADPTFNPEGGSYDVADLFVTIAVAVAGAHLAWTTNGDDPVVPTDRNAGWPHNTVLVRLGPTGGTYTLKAIAWLPNEPNSDSGIHEAEYVITGIRQDETEHQPDGPNIEALPADYYTLPNIEVGVPPFIPKGSQVIQPQFDYPDPATILTSYVPQRRMLRTEEWDLRKNDCTACGVESNRSDNIDRGFSLLVRWTGRMAINGLRIMTDKPPDPARGRCEEDEETARSMNQSGCGDLSDNIVEPPTLDIAPLKSQYLRSITHRAYDDVPYNPVPVQVAIPQGPPPQAPSITITPLPSDV